jgi:hypothetical protein
MTYELFEVTGIEIEYMIVDRETLAVRPIADLVLGADGELELGSIACSNELVLHVIELKTNGPGARSRASRSSSSRPCAS